MTTIDARLRELARILGVDPTEIRAEARDWVALMREGVIVELHIGRWRGVTALEFGDLGVDDDASSTLFKLGIKYLMPPALAAKLQSLDVAARNFLRARAIPTGWGLFVPAAAFENVYAALKERREAYMAAGREVVANYETWKRELLNEYRQLARQAYRRYVALHAGDTDKPILDEDLYVEYLLRRIDEKIPSAETIRDSFYFRIELTYIPLPSLLEADLREAEQIRSQRERERAENRARELAAWSETEAVEAAVRQREEALRRMNEAVLAQARAEKDRLVQEFLTDLVGGLRQKTYEIVTQALEAIRRRGSLHPRSAAALKDWVAMIRTLDMYGDRELESMIARVQPLLVSAKQPVILPALEQTLDDIVVVVKRSLLELGVRSPDIAKDDTFSAPDLDRVRQARTRLGLPERRDDIDFSAERAVTPRANYRNQEV
jgi:hypothetical protein